MNNNENEVLIEHYIEDVLVIVKNLLKQHFLFAPSHGIVGVDVIFRDGEVSRIISRNENSTLIGPSGGENAN